MGLFKPDLYRSFAIGFALSTALMVATMSANADKSLSERVIPAAQAQVHPDLTLAQAAR